MTSNFIQTIQINNLNRRVNGLATEIANITVGGTPVIAADIEMNNNSITEIDQLIFNSGHALQETDSKLSFNNSEIITENDLSGYQLQVSANNLDMNNYSLFNVNGFQIIDNTEATVRDFTLINGNLVSNNDNDVRLYINVNETSNLPSYTDFRNNPLINVGSINYGIGVLTSTDGETLLFNGDELASYTLSNDINGVNQYGLRQISNLTLTSGGGVLFGGVQNKLVPDADNSDILLYNNVPIITSSDLASYLPAAQWVGAATSSLNMQNYNITNATSITTGSINPNSINFNNDVSKKLTVLGGDLQYQGATVITSSDIGNYQTFQPTANQDLNMNNHAIRDAGVGEFGAINFSGNSNYHLSATADGLLYQSQTVITEANFGANMPTFGSFEAINFSSDINNSLAGVEGHITYSGYNLATENYCDNFNIYSNSIQASQNSIFDLGGIGFSPSDTQLTMNNDGEALWSGATILTSANTNIPLANQVYNVANENYIIMPNISINANSVNYFKGTLVGSSFVVEFSGVALNPGGSDPTWVTESESTSIIYGPSDITFDTVNFEASNAGVNFTVSFKSNITDTIIAKIEKINNI